jgi:6-pyruvoyltetrahydropterin/6-carboxytetrahydropterin synthase
MRVEKTMPYSVYVNDPKARFSAAHFLVDHNKCSRIHGHNYTVRVQLIGKLNSQNFVVDFFELKEKLRTIADELDHAILLPAQSKQMKILEKGEQLIVDIGSKHYEFPKSDTRLLPIVATTAELLAQYFHSLLKISYPNLKLTVEVSESEGATAQYFEE